MAAQTLNIDQRQLSINPASRTLALDLFFTKLHCWQEIYKFLDYTSRVRCETTCKSVRQLIFPLWTLEKRFSANDIKLNADVVAGEWWRPSRAEAVAEISARIGDSLLTLDISRVAHLSATQFHLICDACPNLSSLDLSRSLYASPQTDLRFDMLARLKTLRLSALSEPTGAQLTSIPASVDALHKLRVSDQLSPLIIGEFLRAHPSLIELDIANHSSSNEAIDIFLLVLENAPNIRRLSVGGRRLLFDGIQRLAGMDSLSIDCADGRLIDAHLSEFCKRNVNLQCLSLKGNLFLKLAGFKQIGTLVNLREFQLSYYSCEHIDVLLRPVVEHCGATLRRLNFEVLSITDVTIDRVASCCPNLRALKISACASVTAAAVRRLIDEIVESSSWCGAVKDKLEVDIQIVRSPKDTSGFGAMSGQEMPPGVVLAVRPVTMAAYNM